MLEDLKSRNTAIEITAAGIDVAKVSPTLSPRYTLAAVKPRVINAPRMIARTVSSASPPSLEEFNARSLQVAHQLFHRPAISPAARLPSESERNHMPIIWPTRRFGESLVVYDRPTGLRHSSPSVCSRYVAMSQ